MFIFEIDELLIYPPGTTRLILESGAEATLDGIIGHVFRVLHPAMATFQNGLREFQFERWLGNE